MVLFPNCKINLGLNIIRKREDGYHDLETIFYPLPIYDVIEIIHAGEDHDISLSKEAFQTNFSEEILTTKSQTSNVKPQTPNIQLSSSGISINNPDENICIKAYNLLKKDYPDLPPVKMHLHKAIPAGAGLGGGSADGAFSLKLLNKKFLLNLSTCQLIRYSLQLGSDCPFFIINRPCLATGRGEILKEISLNLSTYQVIIIKPGIHIETNQAFSQITSVVPAKPIIEIIHQPIETWKEELRNDFEEVIFKKYPEISTIKEALYNEGAIYSALSGSGSSVYGIFKKEISPQFNFPADYFVRTIEAA